MYMKPYKKIIYSGFVLLLTIHSGCKKILEEHPQSNIVPSFFNSPAGLLGGITAVYNDLRAHWGTEGFSLTSVGGTDEHLTGASNSAPKFYTYNGLQAADLNGSIWAIAYRDINTLNGVLEFGQTVDMLPATKAQYLAQAKFLRAFWYYHLVITFGNVPLHTTFITSPSTADSRAPIADVYAQIIKDLREAADAMPNVPTAPFKGKAACKPTALFLLAKSYLCRGWSGAAQPNDFQDAYRYSWDSLWMNKAVYQLDLWQDYADAFKPGPLSVNTNDYGKETIFVSDHSIDQKYGQYTVGGQASGGAAQNLTPWFNRWNYPATTGINTYKNASGVLIPSGQNMMIRDVTNGRPYIRIRPNVYFWPSGPNAGKNYLYDQAFADRVNDSRYDKTFQTVWISNIAVSNTAGAPNNTRGISYSMTPGVDTAVWFADYEVPGAPQFFDTRPFKGFIVTPRTQSNTIFPAVKKFDDPFRTVVNDPSTRPVVLWRFSDVLMTAAEAAFKLNNLANAANAINIVRQRAAYRATNTPAQNTAAAAAVTITSSQVTLDFILDERTREFYGEWQRWWDLVRTQSLVRRVTEWNPEAAPYIKPHHVLRPIPQTQIDLVTSGPPFPQNPGY
jgi:hypothetical protein